MADPTQTEPVRRPAGDKAPLLLAGGGVFAGFCVASCCGLPVLLGSVGLGSGWLVTLAWLTAPHRTALLIGACLLLAAGFGAFWWRRRVAICTVGASPSGWAASAFLTGLLLVGAMLVVLGYLYA